MRFDDALPLLAALLPLSSAAPGLSDTDQTTTPASLVARTDVSNDGTLHCGNFATGSKITSRGLLTDIDAGANGKIAAATFLVKAGACQRVHCWDTTGVYVCNVSDFSFGILTVALVASCRSCACFGYVEMSVNLHMCT